MDEKLTELISKWRLRSVAQDHELATIDRLAANNKALPDTDGAKLIVQAHQNELERCIMELEEVLG